MAEQMAKEQKFRKRTDSNEVFVGHRAIKTYGKATLNTLERHGSAEVKGDGSKVCRVISTVMSLCASRKVVIETATIGSKAFFKLETDAKSGEKVRRFSHRVTTIRVMVKKPSKGMKGSLNMSEIADEGKIKSIEIGTQAPLDVATQLVPYLATEEPVMLVAPGYATDTAIAVSEALRELMQGSLKITNVALGGRLVSWTDSDGKEKKGHVPVLKVVLRVIPAAPKAAEASESAQTADEPIESKAGVTEEVTSAPAETSAPQQAEDGIAVPA